MLITACEQRRTEFSGWTGDRRFLNPGFEDIDFLLREAPGDRTGFAEENFYADGPAIVARPLVPTVQHYLTVFRSQVLHTFFDGKKGLTNPKIHLLVGHAWVLSPIVAPVPAPRMPTIFLVRYKGDLLSAPDPQTRRKRVFLVMSLCIDRVFLRRYAVSFASFGMTFRLQIVLCHNVV